MDAIPIREATSLCAYCPTLCMHACPVLVAEASDTVSPWGKMSLARWLDDGSAELTPESAAVLYKCLTCGACTAACRHGVEVGYTLRQARENAIAKGVVAFGASRFEPPVEQEDDAVLPPGVSGVRLFAAGFTQRFLEVARACARRWASRPCVVLSSAEDARCVRDVYPRYGIAVKPPVVLEAEQPGGQEADVLEGPVGYHEACHLVRAETGDPAAVRRRAERRAGRPPIELRWHGEHATCCGAGGAYGETSPEGARAAAERVLDNAVLKGVRTLVTGCASCAAHLAEAVGDRPLAVRYLGS